MCLPGAPPPTHNLASERRASTHYVQGFSMPTSRATRRPKERRNDNNNNNHNNFVWQNPAAGLRLPKPTCGRPTARPDKRPTNGPARKRGGGGVEGGWGSGATGGGEGGKGEGGKGRGKRETGKGGNGRRRQETHAQQQLGVTQQLEKHDKDDGCMPTTRVRA